MASDPHHGNPEVERPCAYRTNTDICPLRGACYDTYSYDG